MTSPQHGRHVAQPTGWAFLPARRPAAGARRKEAALAPLDPRVARVAPAGALLVATAVAAVGIGTLVTDRPSDASSPSAHTAAGPAAGTGSQTAPQLALATARPQVDRGHQRPAGKHRASISPAAAHVPTAATTAPKHAAAPAPAAAHTATASAAPSASAAPAAPAPAQPTTKATTPASSTSPSTTTSTSSTPKTNTVTGLVTGVTKVVNGVVTGLLGSAS